jgi:hypothetical protein
MNFFRAPVIDLSLNEVIDLESNLVVSLVWEGVAEETMSVTETMSKGISRGFSESFSLSDILKRGATRLFIDSVSLNDSISRILTRIFEEALTITDTISRAISRIFSEAISLLDVFTKALKWLRKTPASTIWTKASSIVSTWGRKTNPDSTWHRINPGRTVRRIPMRFLNRLKSFLASGKGGFLDSVKLSGEIELVLRDKDGRIKIPGT